MKYQVVESIVINASLESVKEQVFDLREWQNWSPWLCLEEDAIMSNHKEGVHLEDYLSWQGDVIGVGEMEVTSRTSDTLTCQLQFLKPWKSKAFSTITLSEKEETTEVTWSMNANLPFYLFFMKAMMKAFISKDYKRGLFRLKNFVELGEIPAKLQFVKEVMQHESFYFIGKQNTCFYKDIESSMVKDYEYVANILGDEINNARAICLYNKVDMVKDWFDYSVGFAFVSKPSIETGDLQVTDYPSHKALQVNLEGSYDFLSDAWTGIMMHQRARKLKILKKVPPYEVYVTDPRVVKDPKQFITEVIVPVKG
ncbi:MAG: SRPBCC family protein [Epsilonproteobacteria bacterium]|nr:SRPBCC family protein [Campylobacterota bacterium]